VRQFEESTLQAELEGCAALARFFPEASQVRVPVQVTALRGGNSRLREASVVEFATPEHAILVTGLPLEFDDKVRLEGSRKTYSVDATVVGVRYHGEQKAVALRFLRGPCHWMKQP
jgi:hypothetical protein